MAFCTQCGADLPADARFCPDCGKPVGPAAPAATTPIAEPRPAPAIDPSPAPPRAAMPGQPPRRGGGGAGLILPIMVVVALLVIGVMLWSQRDGARPIAGADRDASYPTPPGDTTVTVTRNDDPATARSSLADAPGSGGGRDTTRTTVTSLDAAFRDDPQGARARYAGPVTVSGTVAAATPGASPSLSLEGRTPFNYVVANLRDASAFEGAVRGSRVTLECSGVTALAGTTILQGCTLD